MSYVFRHSPQPAPQSCTRRWLLVRMSISGVLRSDLGWPPFFSGSMWEAARSLGVSPRTINRKIAVAGLHTEWEPHGGRRVLVLQDLVDGLHEQLDYERTRDADLNSDVKTKAFALPGPKSDRAWLIFW